VTDAAGRTRDENAAAGQRPRGTNETEGREPGERERSGMLGADRVGERRESIDANRHALRPSPGRWMGNHSRPDWRTAPVSGGGGDASDDVLAGPPSVARLLE
jgi:hypothetical protein